MRLNSVSFFTRQSNDGQNQDGTTDGADDPRHGPAPEQSGDRAAPGIHHDNKVRRATLRGVGDDIGGRAFFQHAERAHAEVAGGHQDGLGLGEGFAAKFGLEAVKVRGAVRAKVKMNGVEQRYPRRLLGGHAEGAIQRGQRGRGKIGRHEDAQGLDGAVRINRGSGFVLFAGEVRPK
jgi:hypothetical protein